MYPNNMFFSRSLGVSAPCVFETQAFRLCPHHRPKATLLAAQKVVCSTKVLCWCLFVEPYKSCCHSYKLILDLHLLLSLLKHLLNHVCCTSPCTKDPSNTILPPRHSTAKWGHQNNPKHLDYFKSSYHNLSFHDPASRSSWTKSQTLNNNLFLLFWYVSPLKLTPFPQVDPLFWGALTAPSVRAVDHKVLPTCKTWMSMADSTRNVPWSKLSLWFFGDGRDKVIPPKINPLRTWVDGWWVYPLLYGNNGSLDLGTNEDLIKWFPSWAVGHTPWK